MQSAEKMRTCSLTAEHRRELKQMISPAHLRFEEPMADHTTMRVGGPAEVYIIPDEKEFAEVMKYAYRDGLPIMVIGNGSNLLVGDLGIPGIVVSTDGLTDMQLDGMEVTAGAGIRLGKLANFAKQNALAGLEFASGIPGSLGGAVFMNAGAYGGEMKDVVKEVTLIRKDGSLRTLPAEDLDFAYRHSILESTHEAVISARLLLHRGDPSEIDALQKDYNGRRREKQPLEYPSAGSTFKRPEGHFAGKLIEDSGLRGYRVGDAQVSEKHCGFVINLGSATAADIRELINHVIYTVELKQGVHMEPEVRMIGEF